MNQLACKEHATLLYIDSSLRSHRGHHANVCEAITSAARSQGHRVQIAISQKKTDACEGEKVFSQDVYCNMKRNPDAFVDRMRLKLASSRVSREVLPILQRTRPHAIYAHSVNAVVCEGILQAIGKAFLPGGAPFFMAEMPFPCEPSERYFYGEQLRAMFERLNGRAATARRRSQANLLDRFAPITVNERTSDLLSQSTGVEIGVMPSPYAVRSRRGQEHKHRSTPLRIGSVGHQSEHKGFDLLPAIIESLGNQKHKIQWVIQHQDESNPATLEQLKTLQQKGFDIELVHRDLTPSDYEKLLLGLDVILLPYKPQRYQSAISGICYEGLSQGSVVIAPRHTTVGKIVHEFQPETPQFDDWTSESIAAAVRKSVENADPIGDAALAGAALYAQTNGPDVYARRIMSPALQDLALIQPDRSVA